MYDSRVIDLLSELLAPLISVQNFEATVSNSRLLNSFLSSIFETTSCTMWSTEAIKFSYMCDWNLSG